jgi:hypothetical protein
MGSTTLLARTLPEGPASWVVNDHTAHHRVVLAVYARLRGRVPATPYMQGVDTDQDGDGFHADPDCPRTGSTDNPP